MLDFFRKKQAAFGAAAEDDPGIEIHRVKTASRRGLWTESLRLLRDVVLVVAVFVLLMVFVAQPVIVEGTSMLPQLHDGERLLVNKLIYYKIRDRSWGHIERGDVVVFWYPNDPDKSYVKRVIGLPGEKVEMRNGVVYINGRELREDYLDAEFNRKSENHPMKTVPEHYYFVLGDNRDNSADSRTWGTVPEKYIYGKVFFRYWGGASAGFLPKGDFELNEDSDDRRASGNGSTDE